jgi:hypothetical protein
MAAAEAMRRILVEATQRGKAEKRGGDQAAAALDVSPRAADWLRAYARAWLFERMHPDRR